MSSVHSALEISTFPKDETLPTAIPNLMPFHINHTGPAPISTFFRVKPGPSRVGAPEQLDMTLEPKTVSAPIESTSSVEASTTTTGATRLMSSFRGRTVHGIVLDLPAGYSGLVLQSELEHIPRAAGKRKGKAKTKETKPVSTGRVTRTSSRAAAAVEELENEDAESMDVDPSDKASSEEKVKTLIPTSIFPSLVLWHSDIPVDEGNDEYARSMSEWTNLATQMHQTEEE